MIIALNELNKPLKGVIHVGSHIGQEYEEYSQAGIENMIFFEPVYSNYVRMVDRLPKSDNIKTFNLALGSETGQRKIYVETRNDGMSCSLLEPLKHLEMYPWITFDSFETVNLDRLDNVPFEREKYNILNIDVQGYELEVLMGAIETLKHIDAIYTEVNAVEMYKGCALVGSLDAFLCNYGFTRVADNIEHNGRWGDALYTR